MALDHSRLSLENKFLEKKSGRIFCVRQVCLTKSCQQIWGCKLTFYNFCTSHLRWNSIIYHTDLGQNAVCHNFFFKTNCTQSIVRTINRGLLAKPFKKFPKSPNTASRFSQFWQICSASCCRVFEWTLIEVLFNIIKNSLCLFFIFNGFITMCNLKKRLIRPEFWVLLQCKAMFMNDWKQRVLRLKLQDRRDY